MGGSLRFNLSETDKSTPSITNTMTDSTQDFAAIDALLKVNQDHTLPAFSSSQWLFLNDRNNGSYTNEIMFDAEGALPNWVLWDESYAIIPWQISSSTGTPYTQANMASMSLREGGSLNLISGLQVGDADSTYFTENTGSRWLRNQIAMAMEHGSDYLLSENADSGYYPLKEEYSGADCVAALASPGASYGLNVQPFAGAAGAAVDVGATISTTIRNPLYNQSFEQANRWFQNNAQWLGNGKIGGVSMIKLRDLHPFFAQLNFPMKGWWMKLTLYTLQFQNFAPICVANGLPAPVITIGNNGSGLSCCQLYYRAVMADGALKQRLNAKLKAGYDRDLSFTLCDWFGQGLYNNTAQSITQVTNNSVVAPQRIWTLLPPAGSCSNVTQYSAIQSAGSITQYNVIVGGRQYMNLPLRYSTEFFSQMKEAMSSSGVSDSKSSSINFQCWRNSRRWYPLTLARLEDDRGVTTPCEVQVIFNRADLTSGPGNTVGACDIHFLTDRMWNIRIHQDETGVKMVSSSAVPPK